MKTERNRICPGCGTEISAALKFCPICMLQAAAGEAFESSESVDTAIEPKNPQAGPRFDNYELLTDSDGKLLELGRGAMGVTYKAFDVDLQFPVTLKLINEKYLGDESARLRFLREARAAASVPIWAEPV